MHAQDPKLKRLVALIGALASSGAFAQNLPVLSSVVSGSATTSIVGNAMTVTNSANAILEWSKFSIAGGFSTHFAQPNAASSVLNRVVGADPSNIFGSLTSNGKVFLINPNGIVFGQGSQINVGALAASTVPLSNANFLTGNIAFGALPTAGNIDVSGTITAVDSVVLQATNLSIAGTIRVSSPNGTITVQTVTGPLILQPGAQITTGNILNTGGSLVVNAGAVSINTSGSTALVTGGGGLTLNASGNANTPGNGSISLSGVGGVSNPGCGGVAVSISVVCVPSANQKLILSAGPNITGITNTVQGQIAAGIRGVVSLTSTATPGIQFLVPTLPGGTLGSVINAQGQIGLLANRTTLGGTAIATSAVVGPDGTVRLVAQP